MRRCKWFAYWKMINLKSCDHAPLHHQCECKQMCITHMNVFWLWLIALLHAWHLSLCDEHVKLCSGYCSFLLVINAASTNLKSLPWCALLFLSLFLLLFTLVLVLSFLRSFLWWLPLISFLMLLLLSFMSLSWLVIPLRPLLQLLMESRGTLPPNLTALFRSWGCLSCSFNCFFLATLMYWCFDFLGLF